MWENWQLRIPPCIVIRHWPIPWSSDTMVFDDAKCFCKCYKYFKWKEWLAWDSFSIRYMHFLTYGRKFVSACSSFVAFLRDHTDEQYANGCILSRICGFFFQRLLHTAHVLLSNEEETRGWYLLCTCLWVGFHVCMALINLPKVLNNHSESKLPRTAEPVCQRVRKLT